MLTADSKGNDAPHIVADQVSQRLDQIFDKLIIVNPVGGQNEEQVKQRFRTQAYVALSLLHESGASISDAAASITDGGEDDGIDAVYTNDAQKKIFLVQGKWLNNTKKGIDLSEFTRFRDGVKRVIGLQWDAKNANLHGKKSDVERLLRDIDTEVIMIFAHNSEHSLSSDIIRAAEEFIGDINRYGDILSFKTFDLKAARETARSTTRPENINVAVMLKNWGMINKPYKAVYGAISAEDAVKWYDDHGDRLFAENLRFGIEKSEVNDGIRTTASIDPAKFWYFNNGITAICEDVEKTAVGGSNTDSGVFDISKISVINGAQTVSSLHRSKSEGADLKEVFVHMRIISLAGTPESFSVDVTTANNTQNDLSPVDFVAGDSNQDRIRREAAHLGLIYSYRRGDEDPDPATGFTIRTATIAAACASGDIRLAVSAKRYISGLWENTKREPYTKLFNDSTLAQDLWDKVRITKAVDEELEAQAEALDGRNRLIAIHANRFITFIVFENLNSSSTSLSDHVGDLASVKVLTKEVLASVIAQVDSKFPDAYPGNIFKNTERQSELLEIIKAGGSEPQKPADIGDLFAMMVDETKPEPN